MGTMQPSTSLRDGTLAPGETGSFPSKWIGPDGKTLYLAFSGNDNFSLRKVALQLKNNDG
ncbi:hypothetical protein DRO22_01800 [Candidatus Bathyarchaeota archaeon]|nr:MAG: hypothetical protein DRO22_01800 [Candidatus Bathyarchaeota archaeon]